MEIENILCWYSNLLLFISLIAPFHVLSTLLQRNKFLSQTSVTFCI